MTTTLSTTDTQVKANDRLLRLVLKVDALASGAMGLGLVALGKMHDDLFGLPTALTMPAGIFLLVYATAVWFISTRLNPAAVWAVILGNVMWVIASATMIIADPVSLTGLGIGYVALQAAAVALFAELELIGLRRANR